MSPLDSHHLYAAKPVVAKMVTIRWKERVLSQSLTLNVLWQVDREPWVAQQAQSRSVPQLSNDPVWGVRLSPEKEAPAPPSSE